MRLNEEKESIETAYHEGGAGWLFDGEHAWQEEDTSVMIYEPYQVDLCNSDGTVIEENVKLKTRPELNRGWPFPDNEKE